MVYNPSLREQPRQQPAPVIPMERNASILDWLEGTGRLLARQSTDLEYKDDEAEINALMGSDDNSFDDDDDDDTDLDLDD
jgi:phosphopantothenoylcysteine synthetase/decarboxylase